MEKTEEVIGKKGEKAEEPNYLKEIATLNQSLRAKDKQIRGYKGLLNRKNQESSHSHTELTEDEAEKSVETVNEPHYVGKWQKLCPTCGEQNPEFKDETVCNPDEGGCGMHLGAKDDVVKLKSCPNCGGKKVKLLI